MPLFEKRIERSMEVMKERNRRYLEELEDQQKADEEKARREAGARMGENYVFRTEPREEAGEYVPEEELGFEKGDLLAIIVSALMVFWPIFLVLGLVLFFAVRMLGG